ncbi:hypothetical protein NE578_10585, partial [Schaalia odontolytica]|uniref:hypothetical protein n=1 Tax=Schaalia odontolytica TaxID=1660 RepID=UPI00210E9411
VGSLLLDFLIYVQPLRQRFNWQKDSKILPPFLFSKEGVAWNPDILTGVLRDACTKAQVPTLSMSHWRQIAASI